MIFSYLGTVSMAKKVCLFVCVTIIAIKCFSQVKLMKFYTQDLGRNNYEDCRHTNSRFEELLLNQLMESNLKGKCDEWKLCKNYNDQCV